MKTVPLAVLIIATTTAEAHEIQSCYEASVGIETLVTPIANNVRSFYNDRVQIYNINTIEPAAAPAGIVIVLPSSPEDDPIGGSKCLAIRGFSAINIKTARAAYDPAKGLSLSIPTRKFDPETDKFKPGPRLNISINLQRFEVTIADGAETKRVK
jgi:hypothetical protein